MKPIRLLFTCLAIALAPLGAIAATPAEQNEKLLKATDPYEGLTESAIDGAAAKVAKALKTAKSASAATRTLLSPEAAGRFDTLLAETKSAQAKSDLVAVALASAELYKLLVTACDPAVLAVPAEVNLLDYVGFRSTALLKAAKPDWSAFAATAQEGNALWTKIRARVTDKKLQAGMDQALAGLTTAAAKQDAALAATSAKQDLDLVDELEHFFAKK
jgi:DNA-binding GntR family transcriptional regulator